MSLQNISGDAETIQRITYLVGAGASFDALPVTKNMAAEVNRIISRLTTDYNKFDREHNLDASEPIRFAVYDMRKLAEVCKEFSSIDTYAKMLYLTGKESEYKQVKNLIILFFELYYYYHRRFDRRYDSFWTYYLQKGIQRLPTHVSVISWNYDYEFEKAFSKCGSLNADLEEIYRELPVHHKGIDNRDMNFDTFNIVKLNGTAGYLYNGNQLRLGIGNYYYKSAVERELNYKTVCPTIFKYNNFVRQCDPLISFAWEKEVPINATLAKAIEIMKRTTILVVIGYSFPEFNWEFDTQLLNKIATPNLNKIYVQDKEPDVIIERLKEFRQNWSGVEFFSKTNLEKFYIPHL